MPGFKVSAGCSQSAAFSNRGLNEAAGQFCLFQFATRDGFGRSGTYLIGRVWRE